MAKAPSCSRARAPERRVRADGLGLKAEMAHDRNAALDKTLDYVFVAVDAFNFYGDGSRG